MIAAHTRTVTNANDPAVYMELVQRTNEATHLLQDGQLDKAETIFRDVLRRKPAAGFDEVSIAVTQHELGKTLRELGKLDEALELLTQVLVVREHYDETVGTTIVLSDSNITRDEIAKVYEAMGDCVKALEIREPGKRICSSQNCQALTYEDLQGCSQCKSVFYCGRECQRQDWKHRHKSLCRPVNRAS